MVPRGHQAQAALRGRARRPRLHLRQDAGVPDGHAVPPPLNPSQPPQANQQQPVRPAQKGDDIAPNKGHAASTPQHTTRKRTRRRTMLKRRTKRRLVVRIRDLKPRLLENPGTDRLRQKLRMRRRIVQKSEKHW